MKYNYKDKEYIRFANDYVKLNEEKNGEDVSPMSILQLGKGFLALQAENKRLREALETLSEWYQAERMAISVREFAIEALEETTND